MLDNHMATHSDEHPYKCDFCPKMFKTYKQMGLHRKNAHQEEWEENKAEIMKRNRVLAIERRYKNNKLNICGQDNGQATLLNEATGMVYNAS